MGRILFWIYILIALPSIILAIHNSEAGLSSPLQTEQQDESTFITASPVHKATRATVEPRIHSTEANTPESDKLIELDHLNPSRCFFLTQNRFDSPTRIRAIDCENHRIGEIALPENTFMFGSLQESLSPDGRKLVIYSQDPGADSTLTLWVKDLVTGKSQVLGDLFSSDYQEYFTEQSNYLNSKYPDLNPEVSDWTNLLEINFESHLLQSRSWSPDGLNLAFSSQDGSRSPELMIYSFETDEISQLTEDLEIITSIRWSPNGTWILITSYVPSVNHSGKTLHGLRVDTPPPASLKTLAGPWWWRGWGWISDDKYLLSDSWDGGDPTGLRYIDLPSGATTYIFRGQFLSFDYDPEHRLFVLSGVNASPQAILHEADWGTWTVDLSGNKTKITDHVYWRLEFLGSEERRFIGMGADSIDFIGSTEILGSVKDEGEFEITVSPDRNWFVIHDGKRLELYSSHGNLISQASGDKFGTIVWHPSSEGFFVTIGSQLFYLNVQSTDLELVYDCVTMRCFRHEEETGWYLGDHVHEEE